VELALTLKLCAHVEETVCRCKGHENKCTCIREEAIDTRFMGP